MDEQDFELQSRSADRFAAAMCMLALIAAVVLLCGGVLLYHDDYRPAEAPGPRSDPPHPTSPSS
jgi:hypothetical protein